MIKLIIFDLDDTLYNEKKYVLSGFKAVAKFLSKEQKISSSSIYGVLVKSFERYGRGKNFDYIIKKFNLKDINPKKLVKVYQSHVPTIRLFPEAKKVLAVLHKNYTLVLLTNGWVEVQKRKVRALKLKIFFDAFFYAQENGLQFRKPHKEYFLKIIKKYHLRPSEVLMVGDELKSDIKGAKELGFNTYHTRNPKDLKKLIIYAAFSTR